jgi:hypothetical protein
MRSLQTRWMDLRSARHEVWTRWRDELRLKRSAVEHQIDEFYDKRMLGEEEITRILQESRYRRSAGSIP